MSRFFNKYPYTDFHELNIDWLLDTVKHLEDDLDSHMQEYIEENINKMLFRAMYDASSETIIFMFE